MLKHQVIIIGGGLAGLSAALEFIENGVNKILVLEADQRLGGRLLSSPCDNNAIVELGAQWIYGRNNRLHDLCKTLKILEKEKGNKKKEGKNICYATQDGKLVDEKYVNNVLRIIDKLFKEIDESAERDKRELIDAIASIGNKNERDRTLLSEINKKYLEYFNLKLREGKIKANEIPLLDAIYESAALKEEKIDMACESLAELSLFGWSSHDDANEGGGELINFKMGFWQLVRYFIEQIPLDKICYNQEVVKIYWPPWSPDDVQDRKKLSDQVISVITVNPLTGQELMYNTDYCVCTLPLGCLKKNHASVFVPKLPSAKITAIERLGFGTVNRLFIVFEKNVFADDLHGIQVLWHTNSDIELKALKKWKLERPRLYESFECFEVLPTSRNVLYTFITGDDAVYIEQLMDECLIDIIGEMLQVCFKNIKFPRIKKLVRSNWKTNKYSLGSHTFIKYGASMSDVKELARPLNKLFFAGEATSKRYGSADGAFESGVYVAEQIIKRIEEETRS